MPYNFKTQEELKRLIYTGNVDGFKKRFNEIKDSDPEEVNEYLLGTKDEGRGLLSWVSMQESCKGLISYLIEAGADVNQQDGKQRTALLLSIDRGCLSNAKELVLNGADINIPDYNEDTPLHVAAEGHNNTTDLIEWLCSAGANLTENKQGATPFHTAAKRSLEAMHALIEYRKDQIDINKQDKDGDTPLHYAATSETEGVNATYLLMLGADRTKQNANKETPMQIADNWDSQGEDWRAIMEFNHRKGDNPEDFYIKAMELAGDT